MSAPRLEVDLTKVEANARWLVERLARHAIAVTGVTKAALGAPAVGAAFVRAGVTGLGDSRVQNLARLREGGTRLPLTLIRSPMLSEVGAVVREAARSMHSEGAVLDALSAAASPERTPHGVILMVELGDLREGVPAEAVDALAVHVEALPGLHLAGLGTNLACQSGIAPDQSKMDQLSEIVRAVERAIGRPLDVVSGGGSAALGWALTTTDVGRVNELRLGESILLGTDPLHRTPIEGLHTDACRLVAEVIEVQSKPAQPWGTQGHSTFGTPAARPGRGTRRQALVALGHQDVDPAGVTPPPGLAVLGASSDHLVLDADASDVAVGDCIELGLDYGALVRAMTSPFVTKVLRGTTPQSASIH